MSVTASPPASGPARLAWSRARGRLASPSGRSVASSAGVNLATSLLASVAGVFLARGLGATDRGLLVTVLIWPSVMSSVASLGLTQATCYWVARRRPHGAAIAGVAARAAAVTGLAVAAGGALLAPIIARDDDVTTLLRIVLCMSPVFIAAGVWMSSLQAIQIRAWNQARSVQPVAYFIGILGLSVLGRLTLTTATVVFCGSLFVQVAFAWWRAGSLLDRTGAAYPGMLGGLYAYGVRVWLSTVPRLVNVRLDQLILSIMPAVAASELGVYAVAASLSWLALPAATAFGSVAFPAIAGATHESAIRRIERTSLLGSAAAAGIALAAACAAAPLVVPVLFGSEFDDAVTYLWLLAPGTVFLALNRVLADLLQGRGRPLSTSLGEGTAALLTVALLALLVPPFGIRGAAAASSIAYLGGTIALYGQLRIVRRDAQWATPVGPVR